MLLVAALLIACGAPPDSPEPVAKAPAARLNVAKAVPEAENGARTMKIEVLLTGDPGLIGRPVDAGEVWVDVSNGGMVVDEAGKVIAKADITNNVRSIAIKSIETATVLAEQPDPNVPGNTLKKIRANGIYRGCEFAGSGATTCYVDVAPVAAAVDVPKNAGSSVPQATFSPAPPAPP